MPNIYLFGGSFNPIHTDHIKIIKDIHDNSNCDEVWIIPNHRNPFKKQLTESEMASWDDRLTMIKIATQDLKYVKIIDLEQQAKNHYTFNSVSKLQNQFPNYHFRWVIGQDLLLELESWYNWSKLQKIIPFTCYIRSEQKQLDLAELDIVNKYQIKIKTFNSNLLASSEIRKGNKLQYQIKSINEYINKHFLYAQSRLLNADPNNQKRLQHALNVAQKSEELAKKYNYPNYKKAYFTGFMHDITKYWTKNQHLQYIEKWAPQYKLEHSNTYHACSGSLYLKWNLLITDSKITNAVKNHTIGDVQMDLLSKIIYVADKISADRHYENVEYYRKLAEINLEKTFIRLIIKQYKMHKNSLDPNSRVHKIYKYWKQFDDNS